MTAPSSDAAPTRASTARERTLRRVRLVLFTAAIVGALLGFGTLMLHLTTDPLADVRAYYDAATRLNSGQPLYPPDADTNAAEFYRYPPLLAIAFRPLAATLSYEQAALVWAAVCVASFVATIWTLGWRRSEVWIAMGLLAMPIAWSLAIGQAQVPVTYLLAVGSPWAVAVAANLKVLPGLVAIFWIGRRDWRALGVFAAWMAGLVIFQFAVEPQDTIDFLQMTNLSQVGEVRNLSPYVLSPWLWAAFVVVGGIVALRLAPTRYGWAAAVTIAIVATPRLLMYMFMTLLAGLRRVASADASDQMSPPVDVPAGDVSPTGRLELAVEPQRVHRTHLLDRPSSDVPGQRNAR